MIKPRVLPECNRCQFYRRSQYLVCAVHPMGYQGDTCLDFRPDPEMPKDPPWAPEGWIFYGDDLVPMAPSTLTQEDREILLDTHPLFTADSPTDVTSSHQRPRFIQRAIAVFKRIIRSFVRFLLQ